MLLSRLFLAGDERLFLWYEGSEVLFLGGKRRVCIMIGRQINLKLPTEKAGEMDSIRLGKRFSLGGGAMVRVGVFNGSAAQKKGNNPT